ncbi:MAG: UDP-galactopyranose mutase, partial [Tolypothrix sp. T3-bin4]|nr:UDP-galactopyranose mutase [Tolypothrix sp. T3-bin4]
MSGEQTQIKNNGISNAKSLTKLSTLTEPQSSGASKLQKLSLSGKSFKDASGDTPDIVCFSHLRWNFVFQRPQHLLVRCAQGRRVFFIEEPMFSTEPLGRLEVSQDKNGVVVVVPHLPSGLSEDAINADLKVLIDGLFGQHNIRKYMFWYYTPMA